MKLKNAVLLLLVALCSCKTTKKIEQSSSEIKTEFGKFEEFTSISEILTDDLKEVITEKVITRNEVVIDKTGKSFVSPVTVSEKKIERFSKKKIEIKSDSEKAEDTSEISIKDSTSFNRETEGMEVIKDITSGITDGLFGNTVQYLIIAISFILLVFLIRRMSKQKGDSR